MILYHVKLKGRVLLMVTDLTTAQKLTELLNNGTLYGVEGDPAAYEAARGIRLPVEPAVASIYVEQTGPGCPVGQLGEVGEVGTPGTTGVMGPGPCDPGASGPAGSFSQLGEKGPSGPKAGEGSSGHTGGRTTRRPHLKPPTE
ncbi:MAG TPA: hypothetical protein VNA25_08225 [Phycisphaerae bacterium]|nr:hypothetical protein [Phycisphaerae bacterium]